MADELKPDRRVERALGEVWSARQRHEAARTEGVVPLGADRIDLYQARTEARQSALERRVAAIVAAIMVIAPVLTEVVMPAVRDVVEAW